MLLRAIAVKTARKRRFSPPQLEPAGRDNDMLSDRENGEDK